jgi:hypothetical protein
VRTALDARTGAEPAAVPAPSWRETARMLRARFESGRAPAVPLDGAYTGRLLAITVPGPLGWIARLWARLWMPWKGKRFLAESRLGENLITNDARALVSLVWPFYHHAPREGCEHFRAFAFSVRLAHSVRNPRLAVMRIDYDLDENPRFWIRDIVDELVETAPGEYLGEAQVRWFGRWRTAAYFSLRPEHVRLP